MYKEWLRKLVTVAEAEAANMVQIDKLGPKPIPFGFINDRWRALLSKLQEGDELWEFRSPPDSWANMAGRAGIALIRDGNVLDWIVSRMN